MGYQPGYVFATSSCSQRTGEHTTDTTGPKRFRRCSFFDKDTSDVPVAMQRQVPGIQKVHGAGEVPQVQHIDRELKGDRRSFVTVLATLSTSHPDSTEDERSCSGSVSHSRKRHSCGHTATCDTVPEGARIDCPFLRIAPLQKLSWIDLVRCKSLWPTS